MWKQPPITTILSEGNSSHHWLWLGYAVEEGLVKCQGLDQCLFLLPHPQQPLASSPTGTSQDTKFSNSCYQCCVSCQCKLWYSHLHFVPCCRIIFCSLCFCQVTFQTMTHRQGQKNFQTPLSDSEQHLYTIIQAIPPRCTELANKPKLSHMWSVQMIGRWVKTWVTHYTSSIAENNGVPLCYCTKLTGSECLLILQPLTRFSAANII